MKDKTTIAFIIIFILLVAFQAAYTIIFLMQLFSENIIESLEIKPEKPIAKAPFYLSNEDKIVFDMDCEISGTNIRKKGLVLLPQYQFNLNISLFNEKGNLIETVSRLISAESDNTKEYRKDNLKFMDEKYFDITIKRRLFKLTLEKGKYYYLGLSINKDNNFASIIKSGRILIKENTAKPDIFLFDIISFINALVLIVIFFSICIRLKKVMISTRNAL